MRRMLCVLVVGCLALAVSVTAAPPKAFKAEVQGAGSVLALNVPVKGAVGAYLVVVGPNDFRVERAFTGSELIAVNLGQLKDAQGQAVAFADGDYKWELRVNTPSAEGAAAASAVEVPESSELTGPKVETWVSSGWFKVHEGGITPVVEVPRNGTTPPTAAVQSSGGVQAGATGMTVTPQTYYGDNLYIGGSGCFGCVNIDPDLAPPEILLKGYDPWYTAHDTINSVLWRWTDDGPTLLRLQTTDYNTGGTTTYPFDVEWNAPNNTLYIAKSGAVGIGTSTPVAATLHLKPTGNAAAAELVFDDGPTPVHAYVNSGSYFGIGTKASGNCAFCITPTAQVAQTLNIDGGKVGIGTISPVNRLDVNGGAVIGASYAGTNTAPTNGLLVQGLVGIGTSTPSTALGFQGLDIVQPNYSAVRLYQTGSSYKFDLAAANNFVGLFDEAAGHFPFIIYSGGPGYSLVINNGGNVGVGAMSPVNRLDVNGGEVIGASYAGSATAPTNGLLVQGSVGIGTISPTHPLHAKVNGTVDPVLMLEGANKSDSLSLKVQHQGAVIGFGLAGGPGAFFSTAALDDAVVFSQPGKNLLLGPAGSEAARISATGKVGIGMTAPTHLLDVGVSGAYCNGGAWVDGSSREYKQDIEELSSEAAEQALEQLSPVTYVYKAMPEEHHVGFIAEDVPELVATKDRKGMSAMDVVAVLTKVVQEQQARIQDEQAKIQDQKSSIEAKEVRIATLEQRLDVQRGLLEQLAQKVALLESEKTEKH